MNDNDNDKALMERAASLLLAIHTAGGISQQPGTAPSAVDCVNTAQQLMEAARRPASLLTALVLAALARRE